MTLFDSFKTIMAFTLLIYVGPMVIENIKKQYTPFIELRTQIGVIYINGTLINSYHHTAELHNFFKNSHIKGILIKIDCLNAASGTSQTIFHEIRHLKKEFPKPIIAVVENNCTAGGYLISSACDYIIATESALIGNIGLNFLTTQHLESDETSLNTLRDNAYQQLIKQIASARKLSLTTIANWADGQIFTGHQALSLGLINELGSMCTAIKILKEKALVEGEIEWIEHKNQFCYADIASISSRAISTQ